jgi:hypothetical protein
LDILADIERLESKIADGLKELKALISWFNSFDVLKLLPKKIDFNLFSKDVYNSRGGQVNLITYLDTTFEIVPETRFYDTDGSHGSIKTQKTWNNISEKKLAQSFLSLLPEDGLTIEFSMQQNEMFIA